ncbi:MAG: hypothetical protein LBQ48_02270 [Oscillospiraceae bacterium]|jgi:sporulation integral membrane protein YlbJ|nr:hypothetical protein [Oscillospiraceae bacterium]
MKQLVKSAKILFLLLFGIAIAALLLLRRSECAAGARAGLVLCGSTVIPSLFMFMALCSFFVRTGLAGRLGLFVSPVVRLLFGLPGAAGMALAMSFIGGYPVGAKCVADLYRAGEISARDARRMLCFCVNAGPAFVLTAVGAGMLNNPRAGWILLTANTLAALMIGVFLGLLAGTKKVGITQLNQKITTNSCKSISFSEIITESVAEAAGSIFGVCAWVVLFSALTAGVAALTLPPWAVKWTTYLAEVTRGAALAGKERPLPVIAALIGFGGLCVHCQALALGRIVKPKALSFFAARAAHALLAWCVAAVLLRFFPVSLSVFSTSSSITPAFAAGSVHALAAMLLMCAVFLLGESLE